MLYSTQNTGLISPCLDSASRRVGIPTICLRCGVIGYALDTESCCHFVRIQVMKSVIGLRFVRVGPGI